MREPGFSRATRARVLRACLQALLAWLLGPALLPACGGSAEPESSTAPVSSGAEAPRRRAPQMQVEGLYGTIPQRKIEQTLEPKLPRLQRCFMQGAQRIEFIAGRVEFYFRVALDGRVEWVYPKVSSVGDRATERCLLEIARATRFPEPQGGGAAEIAWGFELDASEDVRPPVELEPDQLAPVIDQNRDALLACGPGAFTVTAYVAPGGQVSAAGASADSIEAEARIDCVVEAVTAFSMPDPGSYPAKVSFEWQGE